MTTQGQSEPGRPTSEVEAGRLAMQRVAYAEGQRLVDDQLAELDALRQRTVQVLAFVGSATSFLVGTTLSTRELSVGAQVVGTIAALLSIGSLLLACVILLAAVDRAPASLVDGSVPSKKWFPRPATWNFRMDPKVLVDGWIDAPRVSGPLTEVAFYKALALRYSSMAAENTPILARVRMCFVFFVAVTTIQVVVWAGLAWFMQG